MNERGLQKYFFPFPFFDEEINWPLSSNASSQDLTVYEENDKVVVEAALPGLSSKDIDITYQKGTLLIRGNKTESEEDKKRKYYRKATQMFTYRVAVPGNISEEQEPKAEFKDGMMKVIFQKQKKEEPKKIPIQQR